VRRVVNEHGVGVGIDQRDRVAGIPRGGEGPAHRVHVAVEQKQDEALVRVVVFLQPILLEGRALALEAAVLDVAVVAGVADVFLDADRDVVHARAPVEARVGVGHDLVDRAGLALVLGRARHDQLRITVLAEPENQVRRGGRQAGLVDLRQIGHAHLFIGTERMEKRRGQAQDGQKGRRESGEREAGVPRHRS
jgi:hypothetical protein